MTIRRAGQCPCASRSSAAHRLLNQVKKIPGMDENGRIDAAALAAWLAEVRRLCREYARADISDHCIGQPELPRRFGGKVLRKQPRGWIGLLFRRHVNDGFSLSFIG
jgi:hypothetical protein